MPIKQIPFDRIAPRQWINGFRTCSLLALALAPSAWWVVIDHRVWPWDQAWYGEVSVDLWYWFTHSVKLWGWTLLAQMNLKPPAIVWIGQFFVPLQPILGSVENALLTSLLLTEFVLLLFLYRIGRLICPQSKMTAFAGVAFAAGTQCFIGLSHQFFVEPLQGAVAAWVVWIAIQGRDWPNTRIILHVAGSLMVGLLAKASTPIYCFLFYLYIAVVAIRWPLRLDFRAEWRVPSSRIQMIALAGLFPLGAAWYALNYKAVLEHIRLSSSGPEALNYGFSAPVWDKFGVWLRLGCQAFGWPYLLWAFLAALVIAVAFQVRSRVKTAPGARAMLALNLAQAFAVLLIFSIADAVEPRYLYALAVNFAVIFAVLCSLIPSRIVIGFLLLICGAQWITVHAVALGIKQTMPHTFSWLLKVHRSPSQYQELTRIVDRTAVQGRTNIVGVEVDWLNANSASFFAAKHRLHTGVRCQYTSLGYAERQTSVALHRIEDFKPPYVITLDEPFEEAPPNFVNIVSLPVLKVLKSDPRFQLEPFPSGMGTLIFSRHAGSPDH